MSITSRPSVLIADDQVLVAEGLKNLLIADFKVVAVVRDGRSLLHLAQALKPDIVVADIGMPVLNGLDASQRVKRMILPTEPRESAAGASTHRQRTRRLPQEDRQGPVKRIRHQQRGG